MIDDIGAQKHSKPMFSFLTTLRLLHSAASHTDFCLDMTTAKMETGLISSKYIKDYLCKYFILRCFKDMDLFQNTSAS